MKLVDIDILKNEDVCEHCKYKSTRCEYICDENGNEIETLWEMIDNLPEVNAIPIIHGEWTTKRTHQHNGEYYCSCCGFEAFWSWRRDVQSLTNFCPECGANMR